MAYKKIKFPKTHDIGELATLVEAINSELSPLLKTAATLTPYAIEFRYPDATKKERTTKDSEIALRIAKDVYLTMVSVIPFDSQWDV